MKKLVSLGCSLGAALVAVAALEPATPESQGISSQAILDWIDACESTFDAGKAGAMHGFVLLRHGKTVAEGSWTPFDTLNETHMLYSHSKSFTSSAVGFLVDDGKLDLDDRVVDLFPDVAPTNACANLCAMRVRDLLTMNTGSTTAHDFRGTSDWRRQFMAKNFAAPPGSVFRYDSDATYMLAAIVEKKSGMRLADFLKERMFDKIGIEKAWTTLSPQGIACGGWGFNMTTRELARFGQLYLQRGSWNGETLLSPEWVMLATARETWCNGIKINRETIGSGSDWKQGYGFQFWRCRHGAYRADGASGQLTVVMPEQDAVLSVHAGLSNMQKELDLVWTHLLPAMKPVPLSENPAVCGKLRRRLASLAIAPLKGTDGYGEGRFDFEDNPRGIRSVAFAKATDGWECRLTTPSGEQRFPVGFGAWIEGSMRIDPWDYEGLGDHPGAYAVRASGAVDAQGDFRVKAYLTGTTAFFDFRVHLENGQPVCDGQFRAMRGCGYKSKRVK